jgi:NADPH:quinone reductase-like Zn-dependent oxidoreductase
LRRDVELAGLLGADRVFDYARDDYLREERYNGILDNGGGRLPRKLRRAVAPGGVVVLNCGHDLSLIVADFAARLFSACTESRSSSRRSLAPTCSNSLHSWRTRASRALTAHTHSQDAAPRSVLALVFQHD